MAEVSEVADHLDLGVRQVKNLIKSGALPPSRAGRRGAGYDLDACRVAYIRYLRGIANRQVKPPPEETPGSGGVADVNLARARNLEADTRIKILKEAEIRRQTAPIAVIRWVLSRVAAQISAALEPVPGKVKRRLPKLTAAEIEIIKREIVKAQNMAARVTVDLNDYDPDAGTDPGD